MYNNLGLILLDKVFEKEESKAFVVPWWYTVYLCDNFYAHELFDRSGMGTHYDFRDTAKDKFSKNFVLEFLKFQN